MAQGYGTTQTHTEPNTSIHLVGCGVLLLTTSCVLLAAVTGGQQRSTELLASGAVHRAVAQPYVQQLRSVHQHRAEGLALNAVLLPEAASDAPGQAVAQQRSAWESARLLTGCLAMALGTVAYGVARWMKGASAEQAEIPPVEIDSMWNMATAVGIAPDAPMRDLFQNYKSGYESVPSATQASCWLECTQGKVPPELTGTLLRNGPALFERAGNAREYLDGDGLISKVSIKDGKVHYQSRFVNTDSYRREQAAGRFTDLSIFTAWDPRPELLGGPVWLYRLRDDIFNGPPAPKSNAAYNALHWAGKTFAIDWGRPWALDTQTLDVLGDGKADALSKVKYTAHYRIFEGQDGKSTIVFFNPHVDWAKQLTTVTFYEFDDQGNQLSSKVTQFPATYFHDLIVTENYYVLFDCPVRMDYAKTFLGYPLGQVSLSDTISEDLEKRPLFRLYPRRGDAEPILVESPDLCYAFHHVNGFDDGKKLVFDTCTWDRFSLYFTDIVKPDGKTYYPKTKMSRFVIDLDQKTCTRSIIHEKPCEYPVVSPNATGRPYRYSYMCTSARKEGEVNGPLQAITKVTYDDTSVGCKHAVLESWVPGEYKFSMEPIFAPRPGGKSEDDGWLLALVHDGTPGHHGTDVVILDAKDVAAGPVATLRLPHYVPMGVHGSFTPAYLGPVAA